MKASIGANAPQKHLHSRVSFLYQAATYLTSVQQVSQNSTAEDMRIDPAVAKSIPALPKDSSTRSALIGSEYDSGLDPITKSPTEAAKSHTSADGLGLACRLTSHLQAVSLKGQIRLSPVLKHSICKKCHAFLIPGSTMSSLIGNESRGRKKPWADVLVQRCNYCGATKRFPVGMERQRCRKKRVENMSSSTTAAKTHGSRT